MRHLLLIVGAMSLLMADPVIAEDNTGGVLRPGSPATQEQGIPVPQSGVIRIHAVAVLADGTFATRRNRDSIGVRSVTKIGTGFYEVIFRNNRLHRDCFWTGTVADRDDGVVPAGVVGIDARSGTRNGLWVSTRDMDGASADRPFIITVVCDN